MHRDKKIEQITKDLLAMSNVVFKQLRLVKLQLEGVEITEENDEIEHNELILDSLEVKIRKNVINAIILYSPRASDLRKIISCYDISSSLERTGDLVLKIHRYLNKIEFEGEIFKILYSKLHELLSIAETMTKNSIYAFSCKDIQLTRATIELDDVADAIHKEIGIKLVSLTSGSILSSQQALEVFSISSISYNLERIADNATNMAEAAVYLVEGKNIQHSNNDYEKNQ